MGPLYVNENIGGHMTVPCLLKSANCTCGYNELKCCLPTSTRSPLCVLTSTAEFITASTTYTRFLGRLPLSSVS